MAMKKAISAVRYGIETLKVSPDEMFNLISASRGYNGDVYERWLAARIIEVAENDGVGFSQLLVKKFNILSDMAEGEEGEIRKEYINLFCNMLMRNIKDLYTIGFDTYEYLPDENKLDKESFFSGIDYDEVNSFFVENLDSERLKESISNGDFPFLFKFEFESSNKKSDLVADAKSAGIILKNEGSEILYRMIMLERVYGNSENTKSFGFVCPISFLYSEENRGIIGEFLKYFEVTGYTIPDLSMFSGKSAFCICKSRLVQAFHPVIRLVDMKLEGETPILGKLKKLYTYTDTSMFEELKNESSMTSDVVGEKGGKYYGGVKGNSKAVGYLVLDGGLRLQSCPEVGVDVENIIPITGRNILLAITYYGLYIANMGTGYFSDVTSILNGHEKFEELAYNCLPLFLFSKDSNFKDLYNGDKLVSKNVLNVLDSQIVSRLYEKAEVHFCFEAKELWGIGKSVYSKVSDGSLTFSEMLKQLNDKDLLNRYLSVSRNLKGYITSNYSELY